MTRLEWDTAERFYEFGIDRGVLYYGDWEFSAWNGLIRVEELAEDAQLEPSYFEGQVVNYHERPADYKARVEAYVYPDMLDEHIITQYDELEPFKTSPTEIGSMNFSYRSRHSDGYRIHLVYNVFFSHAEQTHTTLGGSLTLRPFEFLVQAIPVLSPDGDLRATAHYYVDTSEADPTVFAAFEGLLYGSDTNTPRFPTVDELFTMFE
jgi:hypothetical protein